MKRQRTLITIDWDFFVPEDYMWDMGHRESPIFLNALWATRGSLIGVMETNGRWRGFWESDLGKLARRAKTVAVSDSHLFAYGKAMACRADNVVIVDAHHDCWIENDPSVFCHNWLAIVANTLDCEVNWVMPQWMVDRKGLCDTVDPTVIDSVGMWAEDHADGLAEACDGDDVALHICRSGCWTPPWVDDEFIEFVHGAGRPVDLLQTDGACDAMRPRWSEAEIASVIDQQNAIVRMAMGVGKGKK